MTPQGINEANENVSPAEVQKYLAGVTYPASREALIENARTLGAPPPVMDMIENLPEQSFGGPQDVMKANSEEKNA